MEMIIGLIASVILFTILVFCLPVSKKNADNVAHGVLQKNGDLKAKDVFKNPTFVDYAEK